MRSEEATAGGCYWRSQRRALCRLARRSEEDTAGSDAAGEAKAGSCLAAQGHRYHSTVKMIFGAGIGLVGQFHRGLAICELCGGVRAFWLASEFNPLGSYMGVDVVLLLVAGEVRRWSFATSEGGGYVGSGCGSTCIVSHSFLASNSINDDRHLLAHQLDLAVFDALVQRDEVCFVLESQFVHCIRSERIGEGRLDAGREGHVGEGEAEFA
mmetsp:Transcript_7739/g.23595  ORF Transcript_7739/g.23595 Transcript_7739/m.23595 type:complete len:211 (-) Transcript_7739:2306-2938(-)